MAITATGWFDFGERDGEGGRGGIRRSGCGNDETVARALELGAADHTVKPFSPTEFAARIRAALRRRDQPAAFARSELRLRYDQHRVTVAGQKVELTATESELLYVLSQDSGRPTRHCSARCATIATPATRARHALCQEAPPEAR